MLNFKTMPKIELHVHLDGSIDPLYVSKKSKKNFEKIKDEMKSNNSKDLNDYLKKFDLPIKYMQTKTDLIELSTLFAQSLKDDNVIYAEVRFAPQFHTNGGLNFDEIIDSILFGFSKVNIKINLILCLMRGMDQELNYKTIKCAEKYLNKGVVAIDLAGAEALYKTKEYQVLFSKAKKLGIPYTIHAGEADGASSILSAIEFETKRIGHGIRIVEDEKIMQIAADNKITFEVCPKSNIDTQVAKNYKNHPIRKMFDKGLLVTINTDNRTVSDISLTQEYENLHNYLNFSLEEVKQANINAINACFLNDKEKEILNKTYLEEFENKKRID